MLNKHERNKQAQQLDNLEWTPRRFGHLWWSRPRTGRHTTRVEPAAGPKVKRANVTSISRQVRLPAQFTSFSGLPEGLRYARWDGGSAFPSDPAEVEFYVPPLVQDVDIISRPRGRMTSLRAVQALSSGTDELCARLRRLPGNVKLFNAKGVHARSTAELALALILASLRGIPEFTHAQDLRLWKPEVFPSLYGRSVLRHRQHGPRASGWEGGEQDRQPGPCHNAFSVRRRLHTVHHCGEGTPGAAAIAGGNRLLELGHGGGEARSLPLPLEDHRHTLGPRSVRRHQAWTVRISRTAICCRK